jgi:hypothetical protein
MDQAGRKILDMIEQGALTAEEGLRLIDAMNVGKSEDDDGYNLSPEELMVFSDDILETSKSRISTEELARMKQLKRWWFFPFAIGLLITTLGALWMFAGYSHSGFGWGFWLSWIPFIIGIFVLAISFQASRGVWLHVRIKQKRGESPPRISFSLPLPLSLTQRLINTFSHKIPGVDDLPLGDISEFLDRISPEEPFYVHVKDKDNGERVEVFIG